MTESTFEHPPPPPMAKLTASGSHANRKPVKGNWHVYPEMAAAGLWTTPSDLARFATGLQQALAGKSDGILSRRMARQMITEQRNHYGLGVGINGAGGALRFGHGGRDEGFDAMLVAYAETGDGAAIMINANDNSRMVSRILEAVARAYRWPDYPVYSPPERTPVEVANDKLLAFAGRYEIANNQMLALAVHEGGLSTVIDGSPDEDFKPEADDRFYSTQRDVRIRFVKGDGGAVTGLVWMEGGKERIAPRIGPLLHVLKPQLDPDLPRTERVKSCLEALGQGGRAVADSQCLTVGARKDFGRGGPARELAGMTSLAYLLEEDVSSRRIERHGGSVDRVIHYRLMADGAPYCLLVHLTKDGMITDFDMVED
jgi:hypothetical protein